MTLWIPLAGYLLGSIPFAFLVAKRVAGVDVRFTGSGNVGAANVLRATNSNVALIVALLDLAKGSAAVWLAGVLGAGEAGGAATGVAAVLGHIYPVWLRFRGGKGVAVTCGAFGVLAPLATLIAAAIFTVVLWATRYVSLGSLMAALALPPLVEATGGAQAITYGAAAVAAVVVFRHRGNLRRLLNRTERRLGEPA
jgi:glycerol-3-phosphate acyltransferase PlsY